MDSNASFGYWLRRRRKLLDLTQDELAQRTSCAVSMIRKIELDDRRPSKQLAGLLADALELRPEEHVAFIRAARGELRVDRLKDLSHPEQLFQLVVTGLPADFPPPRTLDMRRTNLPVQSTPLVGRTAEVVAVCATLRRPEVRLLTLTGPPGIGKTRVGLQAAADLLEWFADGVFFVPLSAVSDPALVALAVASALHVPDLDHRPMLERLTETLRPKQLLLVLDNFEQVLDAAAMVAALLAAASDLKVLVTSQAALRISGEHAHAVPPLGLPDPNDLSHLELVAQSPAIALFTTRARAVKPDFALTAANAASVAAICARLDGLPLAIELAAARSKLFPPQTMLKRLECRLALLAGGPRDVPARQQTLHRAITWSHDLLSPPEQRLFARLAVFVRGCTLEAVEVVCTLEGERAPDVLDTLQSLLDKSLLYQVEDPHGELRFMMLETIREYALERLGASGEATALRRAHAAFFLPLVETVAHSPWGTDTTVGFGQLEREHDNLHAVLHWALEQQHSELALRLASGLVYFWEAQGYLSEGRTWLDTALALPDTATLTTLRARALSAAGYLALRQADYRQARALNQAAVALARTMGDKCQLAVTLLNLGFVAQAQAEIEAAVDLFEESLTLSRELGDKLGIALALHQLASTRALQGDFARAVAQYEQSLALMRELENSAGIGRVLTFMGLTVFLQGQLECATTLLAESLIRLGQVGNKLFTMYSLMGMGGIAAAQRQSLRAARLWGAAEALREALSIQLPAAQQPIYERIVAAARTQVAEHVFLHAWAEGRAMPLEQARAYALNADACEAELPRQCQVANPTLAIS